MGFQNSNLSVIFLYWPRDHSSITSPKRWVGGVRKWQFLMIYNTENHQRSGMVGLKKAKTLWRNTWMVPDKTIKIWTWLLLYQLFTQSPVASGFYFYKRELRINFASITFNHGTLKPWHYSTVFGPWWSGPVLKRRCQKFCSLFNNSVWIVSSQPWKSIAVNQQRQCGGSFKLGASSDKFTLFCNSRLKKGGPPPFRSLLWPLLAWPQI